MLDMIEEEPTPTDDELELSPSDGIEITDTEVMPLESDELPAADAPVEEPNAAAGSATRRARPQRRRRRSSPQARPNTTAGTSR